MSHDYLFKYILIGNSAVGKSCLLQQFISEKFIDHHDITVGAEFGGKIVSIDGSELYLQIWDTAGEESYLGITRSYFRGAAVALIVYDITSPNSFANLDNWVQEVVTNANENALIVLVGNKTDLEADRKITYEQAAAYAKQHDFLFIETSAKNGENVKDAFEIPAQMLWRKIKNREIEPIELGRGIKIAKKPKQETTKRCCR